MARQIVIVMFICLQLSKTLAAPMHPSLQQQLALQEQMLAIQQFQALRYNAPPPVVINPPQPLLLLLPNTPLNNEPDEKYTKLNENFLRKGKPPKIIEDDDSVTIDTEGTEDHPDHFIDRVDSKHTPMRAVLLLPNSARFSLGGIISSIPFLPFEINVPDSIAWIYNGISGIISGIGQQPLNMPEMNQNQVDMKSAWTDVDRRKIMPIVVVPLGQPMPMLI